MKSIILLLFSITLLSQIDNNSSLEKTKYFEGQVTYDIEYQPHDNNFSSDKIKEMVGSKMVLTFKKGNYKKEYFSPNGELLQERILNLKDKKSYMRIKDSDTIYWFNITKNTSNTTFEVLKDSTILNHPCTIIKTHSTVSAKNLQEKPFELEGIFKYAKDLPVNPDWYVNYKEGNFNEIVKSGKGIAIETLNKGMYWEQQIKAVSIIERKVKKSELKIKIDSKTPLKEL